MLKVWCHTFWVGFGPIERSTHSTTDTQPVIQRGWMRSVLPPYYRGTGVAIRLGRNTLRFGVCYPIGKLTLPDDNDTIYAALYGREVDKTQEGQWHSEDKSA